MADNAVNFTFFANAAAAEKAIVQLERKYTDLENKVRNMGKNSRRAAEESKSAFDMQAVGLKNMESAMGSLAQRFGPLAAGMGAVAAAVRGAIDLNKEWSKSTDDVVKRHDEAKLKLQIQGGLTPTGLQNMEAKARAALNKTPSTDAVGAYDILTQISSSGFKQQDVESGSALKAILDINAATTMFGRDVGSPKDSALAISQFLKGNGVTEPSSGEIRSVGGKITQLFNKSDLQFPHLKELAGEASSLKGLGVSMDEQLAAFATLVDVKSAPEAATGLRQLTTDLATAGASKDKVKALRQIGLKPADVDLVGEDLTGALDRVKMGLKTVDPAKQNQILVRLFGERTLSSATTLMGQSDKFKDLRNSLHGNDFEKAIVAFSGHRLANRNRANIEKEFSLTDDDRAMGSYTWEEYRERRKADLAEARKGQPWYIRFGQTVGEWATGLAGSTAEGLGGQPQAPASRTADKEHVDALKENTAALKANGRIPNRNAQGER